MMVAVESAQTVSKEIYDAQHAHTAKIENTCKEIVQKYSPNDTDISFEMYIGEIHSLLRMICLRNVTKQRQMYWLLVVKDYHIH